MERSDYLPAILAIDRLFLSCLRWTKRTLMARMRTCLWQAQCLEALVRLHLLPLRRSRCRFQSEDNHRRKKTWTEGAVVKLLHVMAF